MSIIPRAVIGPRSNGDVGLFISPSGVNAMSAADSQLLMNISSPVSQLIAMGKVFSSGTVVPLGLTHSPFVFIQSLFDFSGIIGHTLGPGPVRPSPIFGATLTPSTATINSNGDSITFNISLTTLYEVYN